MAVTGIGGLFFRARNPEQLTAWYLEHLGVGANMAAGEYIWPQSAGPTVFAPFKQDTDYFAPDKQWMLNLRVEGLDELLEQLRAAGIDITTKAEWDTPRRGASHAFTTPRGTRSNCGSRRPNVPAYRSWGHRSCPAPEQGARMRFVTMITNRAGPGASAPRRGLPDSPGQPRPPRSIAPLAAGPAGPAGPAGWGR